ncbi:hypothetical protein CRENBAI_014840 [Crenichthys baileyi]|uniref:Uncharacterized protein n=1 Tax=Crenichthys baileyi TaxID=28760 RepID=A0AAV9QQW0_9TELE
MPIEPKCHESPPHSTWAYPHRAPCNATPVPANRCNRAYTVKHRAHNRTPDPTPRWDKLTRQEVPSQRQAIPHHAPATTQTHHITATATIAQVETLSSSALPLPLSRTRCQCPHIQEEDTTPPPHMLQAPRLPSIPPPRPPPRHNSQQSSTPPSSPNHSASASSPSPPANRARPSTFQCRHKTCSTAPPTRPPTAALHLARGKSHKRKHWRKATTARQGPGTLPTPHLNHGGAPGYWPPTLPYGTPRCTKQTGQPLHQSEATSQSTPHTTRPRPPRRSPAPPPPTGGPGTEARDRDPRQSNYPERAKKASPSTRQPPRPEPQPQPKSRPSPLPLQASDPRRQTANGGVKRHDAIVVVCI